MHHTGEEDFQGDYNLGFKPVNINDIPKPCTVLLRYKRASHVINVKVPSGAAARAPKPVAPKRPSIATMERWMSSGVAKATDGCTVEPDGHCEHGKPSWLIVEGVI